MIDAIFNPLNQWAVPMKPLYWTLNEDEQKIYRELLKKRPDGWENYPEFEEDLRQAIDKWKYQAMWRARERLEAERRKEEIRRNNFYYRHKREETEADRQKAAEFQKHVKQLAVRRAELHAVLKDEFTAHGGRTNWILHEKQTRTYKSIGDQLGITGWRVREICHKEARIREWRRLHPHPPPPQPKLEEMIPEEILQYPAEDLELSVRPANCLKNENIRTIGELLKYSPAMLLRVPNFGKVSLREIQQLLGDLGLSLPPNWHPRDGDDWPPSDY